jgi:hypothetical protein
MIIPNTMKVIIPVGAAVAGAVLTNETTKVVGSTEKEAKALAVGGAVIGALGGIWWVSRQVASGPPVVRISGLGMHPSHPMHPYRNGQSAMGCLPCLGLGARNPDTTPWYKSPLWIVAGVGLLIAKTM